MSGRAHRVRRQHAARLRCVRSDEHLQCSGDVLSCLPDLTCWALTAGAGAGVVFVGGASNASLAFVKFENSQNLGLGAGVLAVSDRSRMDVSHAHFIGSFIENQMGLVGPEVPRASCITADDASVVSVVHSEFESNTGGDVIFARASATIDLANSVFRSNNQAVAADGSRRRQLTSQSQTSGAFDELPPEQLPSQQDGSSAQLTSLSTKD